MPAPFPSRSGPPNIAVTRTFSKALGLAGERIGGIIANAELIDLLARINVPYPVTATAAALVCCVAGLTMSPRR